MSSTSSKYNYLFLYELTTKLLNIGFIFCFIYLQVVEDGYEFFAKRQLVTLFSAPNYCGEFDNAGGMMSVDATLMCSFQVCFYLILLCINYNID